MKLKPVHDVFLWLPCEYCKSKIEIIEHLQCKINEQQTIIQKLKAENSKKKHFSIEEIKLNDKKVNIYTGLRSYALFQWMFNRIKYKASRMQYVNGKQTELKCGPSRKLSLENEFFLTLVRLRLGLTSSDLACRFKVSQSTVSIICNT